MREKQDWLVWLLDRLAAVRMFMYVLTVCAGLAGVALVAAVLTGQDREVVFNGVFAVLFTASAGICWLIDKRSK